MFNDIRSRSIDSHLKVITNKTRNKWWTKTSLRLKRDWQEEGKEVEKNGV